MVYQVKSLKTTGYVLKYTIKVCNGGLRKDVLLQSLAGCYLNTHEDVEKNDVVHDLCTMLCVKSTTVAHTDGQRD